MASWSLKPLCRSLLNRDGGVWRTGDDPAMTDLNGKYASMQFAHKARAKRLAEEGRYVHGGPSGLCTGNEESECGLIDSFCEQGMISKAPSGIQEFLM